VLAFLLSIKICAHVIDNSDNEILDGRIKSDAGRDEKQLIKFAVGLEDMNCPPYLRWDI